jgi:hypothetical protein
MHAARNARSRLKNFQFGPLVATVHEILNRPRRHRSGNSPPDCVSPTNRQLGDEIVDKMRSIRARSRLLLRKKGRKGYIAKRVFKLVKYIFYKLKRLVAKRSRGQRASRTLQLTIKYRGPRSPLPTRGLSDLHKLKTYQKIIPLTHPVNPSFLFIEFWHQFTKKALILQVIQTCKKVPRRIFASAQYISFEAKNFIRCHLRDWVLNPPNTVSLNDDIHSDGATLSHEPMSDFSVVSDHFTDMDWLMPNLNSPNFIHDTNEAIDSTEVVYGKIPLKRPDIQPAADEAKTKKWPSQKRAKASELIVFHKRLATKKARDESKMRQTRIEEFFKPQASINIGRPSSNK